VYSLDAKGVVFSGTTSGMMRARSTTDGRVIYLGGGLGGNVLLAFGIE
jgi:hypothetical protein